MKTRFVIGAILCAPFLMWGTPAFAKKVGTNPLTAYCSLKSGTVQVLATGLNHDDHCMALACRLTGFQSLEIAGFTNSDWLWHGTDHNFSIADAAGFKAAAKAKALALKPPGKMLLHINYYTSVAVGTPPNWFLYATADYGVCGRTENPN